MSDTPEAPDWWRATNGKWYPPELFTGPPELRPTVQADPHHVEPRAADPQQDEVPPRRRLAVIVIAAVVVVALVAAGAFVLLGGDDDTGAGDDAPTAGSTSTGPVQISGTIALSSSAPPAAAVPTSCDGWATLLRVEIKGAGGTALTTFQPDVHKGGDAKEADGLQTLSCTFAYRANVPAESSYDIGVISVRDGGRPMLVETIEGADKGTLGAPEMALSYSCDGTSATNCGFRRSS